MLLPCSPRSQACADCVGAVRVSALGLRKKRTARELALGRVPRSCTANRWNAATGNPTCGDTPGPEVAWTGMNCLMKLWISPCTLLAGSLP